MDMKEYEEKKQSICAKTCGTGSCGCFVAEELEQLALAEGERRAIEKVKGIIENYTRDVPIQKEDVLDIDRDFAIRKQMKKEILSAIKEQEGK